MQTEGGKKERKKKNFLRFFLRKMNLHCTGAFVRTPHAFFLLSLLDTVSYVQAAWDFVRAPHCSSPRQLPHDSSMQQQCSRGKCNHTSKGWGCSPSEWWSETIICNRTQCTCLYKIKRMDTKQIWCKMKWSKESIKLFIEKVLLLKVVYQRQKRHLSFWSFRYLEVCQNLACKWRVHSNLAFFFFSFFSKVFPGNGHFIEPIVLQQQFKTL